MADGARMMRPAALVRILNSTKFGTVIDAARLKADRDAGGYRIGDAKEVDIFRYAAWMALRHIEKTTATDGLIAKIDVNHAARRELDARASVEIVKTQTDLAKCHGVSGWTIRQWAGKGMPGEKGAYSIPDTIKWRLEQEVARNTSTSSDKAQLEIEKLREDVLRSRHKRQREQGKLIDRDAAKAALTQAFHVVRARLNAAPAELAASASPDKRAETIADWQRGVALILRDLQGRTLPYDCTADNGADSTD